LRPNQIFAVGGLPLALVDGEKARLIVDIVQDRLLTPLGLRTLASGHPHYKPWYRGGVWERDAAYHQGTAWPWLIGPFVEAWLRVHSRDEGSCARARRQFIEPLLAHLDEYGLGHISEVVDAESPHRPGGCPFQAWSLGELLRLRSILQDSDNQKASAPSGAASPRTGRPPRKQPTPH
jgi:glycogen debranching enzyme